MKKLFVAFVLVMAAVCHINAQQAKYVFYFIGDGMGLNQVNTTEMYLAELEGRIGIKNLCFPSFSVASQANSHSSSNSVTDSAAGGTALSTGVKTYNSAMGVDAGKNPVETFAEKAKKAGKRVGITTSVSLDHATPGAFYAHEPYRNMYYEIATWLPKSNFDFFAGSGFLRPDKTVDGKDAPNIFPMIDEAGYTVARGLDEYKAKRNAAGKMVLIEKADADQKSLRYAIDRQPGDLTLAQITESAIDFLMKENAKKGFFLMIEGGKIDWACHANDAGALVRELEDMDNAVKVAYEFLKKHPKEFSGGQLQRISIARALLAEPKVLIADEIVSALDVPIQNQILQLLRKMKEEHHLTVLFITHDLSVAKKMSDRIMVMQSGEIKGIGAPEELLGKSDDPYIRDLAKAVFTFAGEG